MSAPQPDCDPVLDARVRRAEDLVEQLIRNNEVYHAHKENMANAAMTVMLALLSVIVASEEWPKADWIPNLNISISQRWVAFLGFFVLWALIHVFMRWQLRNRRAAAITQAAALRAQVEWVFRAPTSADVGPYTPTVEPGPSPPFLPGFSRLMDWVLPFPIPTLRPDVGRDDYPHWLAMELRSQEAKGSGALVGEWLITLGSYFVLVVVAIRTFYVN